ncbi:GDSL-type esterase/lipase family protein [Tistrella bauzanensis]
MPRLEAALAAQGTSAKVVNAGVSGDTTAGGLARLDWALGGLEQAPDLVIVSLGANDALRGLDPAKAEDNLARILTVLGDRGLPALLVGMRAPNNWGPAYRAAFDGMYDRLAARFDVPLDPFFWRVWRWNRGWCRPTGCTRMPKVRRAWPDGWRRW